MTAVETALPRSPALPHTGRRRPWRAAVEAVALLAAPLVAYGVLRVRPVASFDMVDQAIYSGIAQAGPDVVTRLGTEHYHWTRVLTTGPEHLAGVLLGQVGGFLALRYLLALLATVPVYLLLRRLRGRAAGAVAVAVVLTSPVAWTTWGSDYPDSTIFSCLLAGVSLLVLPVPARRRPVVRTAAGALLAVAPLCQAVAATLVAPVLLGWLLVHLRSPRALLGELAALAAGAALATGSAVLLARAWLGHADIFTPNYRIWRVLQRPDQKAMWHTADWRWVLEVPYVAVLGAVVLGWLVAAALGAAGRGPRPSRAEVAVGLGAVLQVAVAAVLQFAGTTAMLEYRLYSSMLWPGALLLTVLLVAARGRAGLVVLGVVVGSAVAVSLVTPALHLRPYAVVLALAAVAAAAGALAALGRGTTRAAAATVTVAALGVLTIAVPGPRPPGAAELPRADYSAALGDRSWVDVEQYRLAGRVQAMVAPADRPGRFAVVWWADPSPSAALQVSGRYQYLRLPTGVPDAAGVRQVAHDLARLAPEPLIMVGPDDRQFGPWLAAVEQFGSRHTVLRREDLVEGGSRLSVALLRFDVLADPCPGPGVTLCPPPS